MNQTKTKKTKETKKTKQKKQSVAKNLRVLGQIKEVYSEIYVLERKRNEINKKLRLKNNRLKSYLNFLRLNK